MADGGRDIGDLPKLDARPDAAQPAGPVVLFLQFLGMERPTFYSSPWVARLMVMLLDAWMFIPFMMIMLLAGLQAIPKELQEASRVDGATGWRAFWEVTFPLMLPVSVTALLIRIIFKLKLADVIINVTSGAGIFGLPMLSLYCASKFAVEGFSEALSYELASQNIGVKLVEPGGVVSTNFGKRSGTEAAQSATIADYEAFVAGANATFAGLRASRRATEEDVAKVIYEAATDGTTQLRYVATADIVPWVKMRRETSEAEYIAFMRSQLLTTKSES